MIHHNLVLLSLGILLFAIITPSATRKAKAQIEDDTDCDCDKVDATKYM